MKLYIDRGITKLGIYSVQFGVDFDIMIGEWNFFMNSIKQDIMSEVDKIVTNSPNLVFCVTHIKHPLLLENDSEDNSINSGFFKTMDEISIKKKLRNYFAIRLQHRRYPVDLYENGKRLFKN